jgi:hypothetical protein
MIRTGLQSDQRFPGTLMATIAEANSPDPSRAREIARAISARGLWFAVFGLTMFLFEVDAVWGWNPFLGLLSFALFMCADRFVNKYYEQRFGWVEPPSISTRGFVILMGTLIMLFFFGRYVESALSGLGAYLDTMFSNSGRSVLWQPAAFWTLWVFPAALFSRDKDRRSIAFLACATTLLALIGMLPLWFPECSQNLAWRSFKAGWLGLSCIALGFYDHIRLLLLLPKKVEDSAE